MLTFILLMVVEPEFATHILKPSYAMPIGSDPTAKVLTTDPVTMFTLLTVPEAVNCVTHILVVPSKARELGEGPTVNCFTPKLLMLTLDTVALPAFATHIEVPSNAMPTGAANPLSIVCTTAPLGFITVTELEPKLVPTY